MCESTHGAARNWLRESVVDVDEEVRARRRYEKDHGMGCARRAHRHALDRGRAIDTTFGGLGTTTNTVSSPAALTLPTDTATIEPASSEPAFDAFEATLGLAGTTDFNS